MWTVDLGSGSYCRADVCVGINFEWSNPYLIPQQYDEIVAPKSKICDKVLADLNYPLPFRDNAFDKVYIVHTLEHLLCPYRTLLEVRRIMKQNGELIIVVPNAVKNLADWRDEEHIYSFTEKTIERLVAKVFKIEELKLILNDEDIYIKAKKVEQK